MDIEADDRDHDERDRADNQIYHQMKEFMQDFGVGDGEDDTSEGSEESVDEDGNTILECDSCNSGGDSSDSDEERLILYSMCKFNINEQK